MTMNNKQRDILEDYGLFYDTFKELVEDLDYLSDMGYSTDTILSDLGIKVEDYKEPPVKHAYISAWRSNTTPTVLGSEIIDQAKDLYDALSQSLARTQAQGWENHEIDMVISPKNPKDGNYKFLVFNHERTYVLGGKD